MELRADTGYDVSDLRTPVLLKVSSSKIAADFLNFLEDGKCSDVTFIVRGAPLKAHSPILCSRSGVFDKQLHGGMQESGSSISNCTVA